MPAAPTQAPARWATAALVLLLLVSTHTLAAFVEQAAPGLQSAGSLPVEGPPTLKYAGGPPLRAISVCADVGAGLPHQEPVRLHGYSEHYSLLLRLEARLDPVPGGSLPTGARIVVTDIGSAIVEERTDTRIRLRSFWFDLDTVALRTLWVHSPNVGEGVVTIIISPAAGQEPRASAELRSHVRFTTTQDINVVACDAPPELHPDDDDGDRDDDDYTFVLAPRFTVTSSEASVTLLRNGVDVATAPVTGGVAALQDDGLAGLGIHRYQARHGTRQPSAARWIEIDAPLGPPVHLDLPSAPARGVGATGPGAATRLLDAFDRPVANVPITFTLLPGANGAHASFVGGGTNAVVASGADGTANSPQIVAGTVAGAVGLRVESGDLSADGSMVINPGPPVAIEIVSGDGQQPALGATFAAPLAVRVRDAWGNPTQGTQVRFSSPGTGASAAFGNGAGSRELLVSTNALGDASATPRAVGAVGPYVVTAAPSEVPAATVGFSLRNLRAWPATMEALSPHTTIGWPAGAAVLPPPSLRVLDAGGLPIADVAVRFEGLDGAGIIGGATPSTDADGVATLGSWQLGGTLDTVNRVRASVAGLAPLDFVARTRAEHDAAVTVDNGLDAVHDATLHHWAVVVENAGPSTAALTLAADYDGLAPAGFSCEADAGSSCASLAGAGSIDGVAMQVAAGGRVDVTARARVTAAIGSTAGLGVGLVFDANGFDLDADNDTATDVDPVLPKPALVFRDGFD